MRSIKPLLATLPFWVLSAVQGQPLPTFVRTVTPGVVHREYTLPGPMTLDVLEVSRKDPYVRLESFRPRGLVKTSIQAAANDRAGHRVVAAINADFFSFQTGSPVGNQVVNGTFAMGVPSRRSHLLLDAANRPFIERISFTGGFRTSRGDTVAIAGVNTAHDSGATVLYSIHMGDSTRSDVHAVECAFEPLAGRPATGDTFAVRVIGRSFAGKMPIPASGGVLSASGGHGAVVLSTRVAPGDTLSVVLGFRRPAAGITQVLGGAGRILEHGRPVSTDSMTALEGIKTTFTDVRHPRTFFAFTADTAKLFLCTVDGRQATSRGMTFAEMSEFLLHLGASEAFNFDGGGSTTMVVRGRIVNSPSDTSGERKVANTLQVISVAPPGTPRSVALLADTLRLRPDESIRVAAEALDEFLNPVPLPSAIEWLADPAIGTVSQDGFLTTCRRPGIGLIQIRWNGRADSTVVVVR